MRDPANLALATFQPDPTLALHAGESLTLERHRTARSLRQIFLGSIVIYLLSAVLSSAGIFAILPSFGRSALNPLYDAFLDNAPPPPPPSALDWFTLAAPLVLVGVLLVVILVGNVLLRRQRLMADENGLTIGRTFIPWQDVQQVLVGFRHETKIAGAYTILGREQVLSFTIYPERARVVSNATRPTAEAFIFPGGYARYQADAQRLVATLVARSYQPLRTSMSQQRLITRLRRRFPERVITVLDVENAPLAAPQWQPPAKPTITSVDVQLQPRISVRRQLAYTLLAVLGFAVFGSIFGFFTFNTLFATHDNAERAGELVGLGIGSMAIVAYAYAYAFTAQRGQRPIIRVDSKGITKQTLEKSTTLTIAWSEIRAWGIAPPRPGMIGVGRYFVTSDVSTITWAEPDTERLGGMVQGDRRTAYQQRAAELHALIYARTGLPLHDLSVVFDHTPTVSSWRLPT